MNTPQKQSFNKSFLTVNEQINKLKALGMLFKDEEKAKSILENINFYRLSGVWFVFKKNSKFQNNIYFEDILNIYNFDREFRLHMLNAIERIEISIRNRFITELSSKYGIFAHLDSTIFHNQQRHSFLVEKLKEEFKRSKELFSKHFKTKYKEELPPLWISAELMTMGQISNWLNNIQERKDRQSIARHYDLDEKVLLSFLHNLTVVRNISAHHSRLWNRTLSISFTYPKFLHKKMNINNKQNIYNTIVMCKYLMDIIDTDNIWKDTLEELLIKYNIDKAMMGYK